MAYVYAYKVTKVYETVGVSVNKCVPHLYQQTVSVCVVISCRLVHDDMMTGIVHMIRKSNKKISYMKTTTHILCEIVPFLSNVRRCDSSLSNNYCVFRS